MTKVVQLRSPRILEFIRQGFEQCGQLGIVQNLCQCLGIESCCRGGVRGFRLRVPCSGNFTRISLSSS